MIPQGATGATAAGCSGGSLRLHGLAVAYESDPRINNLQKILAVALCNNGWGGRMLLSIKCRLPK